MAGLDGLSSVGSRPGIPALSLIVAHTLGLSVVQVTAALEVALGVAVGVAAFALVARITPPAGAAIAGLLAGTFATHLAAGYLANLATAATFVAAVALLDRAEPRSAAVAAVVLAGGGLAHPSFFLVGCAILLLAAAGAWRSERGEALTLVGPTLGAAAIVGAGLLAVTPGAPSLDVDTSKDAFLRRAGLTDELRAAYLDRFVHRWTRYVQWISVPLAIWGLGPARGTAGRVLRAWFAVTVLGVAMSLVTAWLPADRFTTFGFAIPILAALGLVRLWEALGSRRVAAIALAGALPVAMLAGAFIAWNRQDPFISAAELRAVTAANADIASYPPGTPLAFLVFEADDAVTFLATRAGNVIRAAVPPDRIRDVVVVVTPLDGASPTRVELERITAADLRAAEQRTGRRAATYVLTPFDDVDHPPDALVVDPAAVTEPPATSDPLEPASPAAIAVGTAAMIALLVVTGSGWARVGTSDVVAAAATAPAVGAGVLIVVALGVDAIGLHLASGAVAITASAICAASGYLLRFVLERRRGSHPPAQVHQQPGE